MSEKVPISALLPHKTQKIKKTKIQVFKNEMFGEVRTMTNERGEARFCQFVSAQYGFRAALKLLRTYYTKYGCTTIRQIICRWAPETENQVEAYIKTVCKLTHLTADTPLPPMKAETRIVWCDLVLAMASVECGLSADDRDTLRGSVGKAWNMLC